MAARPSHVVLPLALSLGLSWPASSQVPPPLVPGVIERAAPASPPRLAPQLAPVEPERQRGPNELALVRISGVRLLGNTAMPEDALRLLLDPLVGQDATLAAIEQARIAVISAYGRAGFPFVTASAGLAPVAGGSELILSIIEGRIASVRLDGDIGPAATQVLRFLDQLVDGGTVTARSLERALLLANDVPGVTVRSVVRPLQGGEPGALEVVAQLTRRPFSGYVSVDNRGYQLTGPVQGLLSVGANSFTSLGERIEATIFQAQDWEQTFGQASGEAFLGGSGLRVRAYAGVGRSRPGGQLEAIGYRGNTQAAGLGAQYPIIRSRPFNLFAVGQFDYLNSEVEAGTNPRVRQSLDEVRALRAGFDSNLLDTVVSFAPAPAVTSASIRLHRGAGWLGATRAGEVPGPGRVQSDFRFSKWSAELGRTQPLYMPDDGVLFSIFALVGGQRSDDVLPLSEKYFLGGNRLGRGFYAGQVTGDTALAASVELQLDFRAGAVSLPDLTGGSFEIQPAMQLYAFRDFGRTWENLRTDPDRTIESWGAGLRTTLTENVQLDVEAVRRLTRRVDAAGANVLPLDEHAVFFRVLTRF